MTSIAGELSPEAGVDLTGQITRSLRALLAYHRLNAVDLEQRIGLPKSSVYRKMNGETVTGWSAEEVWAIATFFGIEVGQLYAGNPDLAASRISSHPYRLSRKLEGPGEEPFSGSDIDAICDAVFADMPRQKVGDAA